MLKNEKGSTLAFCVIISCMLSVFVVGIGTVLIASRKSKMNELSYEKGFYLTDSCIAITESKLHDKASEAIFQTLQMANNQVPVTYTGSDGSTEVFDKETFHWLYITQVMKIFSATSSDSASDVLARDTVKFISDPSDSDYDTDPISSAMLTAALAQPDTPTEGYMITSEIEQNTFYGNFASVYAECYPSRLDTGERTYITSDDGTEYPNPDDKYLPGTPLSTSNPSSFKNLENNLNKGLLRVIYTVYDANGVMREKVRVAYSFDMYHTLIDISESQSNRVYPTSSSSDDDDDDSTSSDSTVTYTDTLNPDLNMKVTREYLKS
jgi:hypothetical protein